MIDKALLKLEGVRGMLAFLAGTWAAFAALTVGQAWSLASAVANLWHGAALAEQAPFIVGFFCCFLLRQVVRSIQEARMETFAADRADEVRRRLLKALFAAGPALTSRHGTGNVTTAALEGVQQVETYIRLMLAKLTGALTVPLAILACTFAFDWVSGVIMLAVFPFIVLYMVILGRTAKAAADAQHERFRIMSNHFVDSLRGLETLKLLGVAHAHGTSIYRVSERFRESTMRLLRVATLSGTAMDLFSTFSLAAVAMMLGFRLVDGTIALLPALFVLVMVPEYFKPIREFASDYHASLDGKTALAALERMTADGEAFAQAAGGRDTERGAADEGDASDKVRDDAEANDATKPARQTASAELAATRLRGAERAAYAPSTATDACSHAPALSLRNVSFSYPDGHGALSDVTFDVRGFRTIGIVGASGSGKSTLISLLAGFAAPSEGALTLDGAAVPSLRTSAWQRRVAYIPQNPYVFHATLRENVAFYRPDAATERIEAAVAAVGLNDLVATLPQGIDTVIGQGGRVLSGGQAQRIALARALVDDARDVLLFDEPTAHLDIETELELKRRMLPLMEGRLVFFATHRLHWVADMDEVLVMEGGRVIEHDAPPNLRMLGVVSARFAAEASERAATDASERPHAEANATAERDLRFPRPAEPRHAEGGAR